MTNRKINKAIAEYYGWKYEFNGNDEDPEWYWIPPNNPDGNGTPPDYCNDLNLMREAEKILFITNNWDACAYEAALQKETTSWAWHSTAKQRAQTFLKTIGKWKD